ncbi:mechanosensitive ion channel protein 6-like [Amaranthus tricolor]|uniref:mechanosensitive ion channel protein 6-like n=1 Tax=Amaranthus tricolor TaxID=29722 RepID=UPI00258A1B44|nr:mechanosensitive ion channel protein 6-like [Amaranthus tricolor]
MEPSTTIKGSSPLRKSFTKESPPLSTSTFSSPSNNNKNKKKLPELQEERLGLLQNRNDPMSQSFSSDFSIKIEAPSSSSMAEKGDCPPMLRGSSYDFQNDVSTKTQKNKSIEKTSDDDSSSEEFDFPKSELDLENQGLPPVSESPNEYGKITPKNNQFHKVSFKETELVHRRTSDENRQGIGVGVSGREDQVLRCSSNASFQQKKSGLMRMKTKSRLMDPPEEENKRSGRLNRSGLTGKSEEIEEDDPFDEDFPEEFKRGKLSIFTVLQWVSLILIVAALICSLVIRVLREKSIWDMQLWKWEVMGLVLICGGLVSGWLIRIVVFFIERNFLLRKRVLYFVYGLRSSVQKFLWLGWVLLAWILILDKKVEKETQSKVLPYVTKILICFMVATLMWLIKTLLLKVLAMNFHVSAFFDRIQDALFNQYVIETLSGAPYLEIQSNQEEEERVASEVQKLQNAGVYIPPDLRENCFPNEGKNVGSARSNTSVLQRSPRIGKSPRSSVIGKSPRAPSNSRREEKEEENEGISIDHLHRWNQKNVSAWNMKRLMNIVRKGVLSTLDEQLDPRIEEDSALQIRSEKEAKAAAKRLFTNVASPGSKYIQLADLMRFLREDEANRTIRLFEGAVDGKGISKRALKNWVVNVFRERRALALSLNDTKTAVNKLHHLVNIIVGIAVVVVWLLILGVPVTHFLVFVSSQVVVLAFMFGNTCKTTFEAIIFLFVMHPFDVGDRCEIEGVQMIVEEMNILTTVFLRYDNQKIIYPNSVLATKPISNYYRSPDMGDAIDFCVHVSTPVEKLSLMKERITRYIDNKSDHWYPAPMIVMRDVEDLNRLKFSLWVSHRMNHQDMGERWVRRSTLVEEMIKIFKELDIEYRMLPMDVNVRNMPPLVSDRLPSNWTACAR